MFARFGFICDLVIKEIDIFIGFINLLFIPIANVKFINASV